MNIYALMNEELKRMYEEMNSLVIQSSRYNELISKEMRVGNQFGGHNLHNPHESRMREIQYKIDEIRVIMIDIMKTHDQRIQEKVAELALTGIKD